MTNGWVTGRLWIDGCFDFTHHGHAGALRQARALGEELYVGIHSDEEIARNKGPVVMQLEERVIAVEACKWCTKTVPSAPYVTDPAVMDSFGCQYVVHGDDITTDANGDDCYQVMKDLGRFIVVKRTPNISTTDLVGRMLSFSTGHHIPRVNAKNKKSHLLYDFESVERFRSYATAEDAKSPGSAVYNLYEDELELVVRPSDITAAKLRNKVFYVDGGFDLFFTGHIEFLRLVKEQAEAKGAAVCVGIHDDYTVNQTKGQNYPIMNLVERALCVLQCRYVDAIILNAPFTPDDKFINKLRESQSVNLIKILHGPTAVISDNGRESNYDPYRYIKAQKMFQQIEEHKYSHVSSSTLVDRVLQNRQDYEERQRKKGWKAEHERNLEASKKKTD